MLRLYTLAATLLAIVTGLADVFRRASSNPTDRTCRSHEVICAGGTAYHWASALVEVAFVLVALVWFGWPIILAGRIGRTRNRRGYLAGIFLGWVGLAWVVLRPARQRPPDALQRAVRDYRTPLT